MGNLRRWSSSASGNATVTGGSNTINFAEGQNPSTVNNSAREMMAQLRTLYYPDEWGWVEFSATASVVSQTSFKIAGNQTAQWTSGRRWRLKSNSTTRYGSVLSSTFTAETLVSVSVDSGSLSASHSLVALSIIDTNQFHNRLARRDATNSFSATQVYAAGFASQAASVIEVTDNTNPALRVTQLGTGLALRIEDSANPDSSPVVVDASGNVGIGTNSPSVKLNVYDATSGSFLLQSDAAASVIAQRSADDAIGAALAVRKTRGTVASPAAVSTGDSLGNYFFQAYGGTNYRNIAGIQAFVETYTSDTDISSYLLFGTTSAGSANQTERLRITGNGNVLVTSSGGLGYGTGSGGTVTQLTSKSTGVTINKTNGQIISHNASLAATSEVAFTVTNSTVAATDVVILSKASGGASTKYDLYIGAVAAGSFDVVIRNVTSTSGSDALTINFAVIKAVTS